MRARRVLLEVHSWLGLVSGFFLIVISLSGVALLFRSDLDALLSPHLTQVKVAGPRLPYDRIASAYLEQKIAGRVDALMMPIRPEDPVVFGINHDGRYEYAWFDPYTGRLLGQGSGSKTASGWLENLHYQLRAGDAGEIWAGAVAAVLVLASGTGLFLQGRSLVVLLRWPRRRARLLDSHNLVGSWALVASLLFGITGAWLCRYAVQRLFTQEPVSVAQQSLVIDRYVDRAATVSGFSPNLVLFPDTDSGPVVVAGSKPLRLNNWFYGPNAYTITMESGTAKVISRFDPTAAPLRTTSDEWIYALHTARFAPTIPLAVKLVYAIFGSAPAFLATTGYWLYLRRRGRCRRHAALKSGENCYEASA